MVSLGEIGIAGWWEMGSKYQEYWSRTRNGGFHYSRNGLGKNNKHFWKLGIGNFKALISMGNAWQKNQIIFGTWKGVRFVGRRWRYLSFWSCSKADRGDQTIKTITWRCHKGISSPFLTLRIAMTFGMPRTKRVRVWCAKSGIAAVPAQGRAFRGKLQSLLADSTRTMCKQPPSWRVRYPLPWISLEFCFSPIYMNQYCVLLLEWLSAAIFHDISCFNFGRASRWVVCES